MNNRAWSKAEAAALVGCCEKTMERLIAEGKIRAHKVGNRCKIFQVDIDAFLEAGVNKPRVESADQLIASSEPHAVVVEVVGV
jgi:excisionase family DNA binding protein